MNCHLANDKYCDRHQAGENNVVVVGFARLSMAAADELLPNPRSKKRHHIRKEKNKDKEKKGLRNKSQEPKKIGQKGEGKPEREVY